MTYTPFDLDEQYRGLSREDQARVRQSSRPCPHRFAGHESDDECWSGNCTLAAKELRQNLLTEHTTPIPLCSTCGYVDVPEHRLRCRLNHLPADLLPYVYGMVGGSAGTYLVEYLWRYLLR
jgi:hypothetical protein